MEAEAVMEVSVEKEGTVEPLNVETSPKNPGNEGKTATETSENTDKVVEKDGTCTTDVADNPSKTCSKPEDDKPTEGASEIDPYAYLKRDEFTSEIFKIEITNLPKRFGMAQLRKRLFAIGLKPSKLKAVERSGYAFVNFRCEDDREESLKKLNGHVWKGKTLGVKRANPAADPLLKKRKLEAAQDQQPSSKVQKTDKEVEDNRPISDILNDAVTPFWSKPYPEQLALKEDEMKEFLRKIGRLIEQNNYYMKKRLRAQREKFAGLPCQLHAIKPSPIVDSYRNKCEFTVGTGPEGKEKTVGFRTGSYKSGSVRVVSPEHCVNIPQSMKDTVKVVERYLQTVSTHPAYDPAAKDGRWTTIAIRTNQRQQVMCVLEFNPESTTKEDQDTEAEKIKRYFEEGDGKDCKLHSLYYLVKSQRHEKDRQEDYRHLSGEKIIEEDLLEMKFRISPEAFFQVNTPAAEVLYSTIASWCQISENTILLDICCGTGTIGLTMAKGVKKVIGVEMCAEAVEDAKVNAEINGIKNAEFYAGKAEDILPILIRRYSSQEVVAVVDPPRTGLHPRVVQAIRKATFVSRLIYVSCKPKEITNNILDLTRSESRRVKGPEFTLTEVVPVDLFPHTQHCELVLKFERDLPGKTPPEGSTSNAETKPVDGASDSVDHSTEAAKTNTTAADKTTTTEVESVDDTTDCVITNKDTTQGDKTTTETYPVVKTDSEKSSTDKTEANPAEGSTVCDVGNKDTTDNNTAKSPDTSQRVVVSNDG